MTDNTDDTDHINQRALAHPALQEEQEQLADLPTQEEAKQEQAVIDAIEQIVMHLKKLGISHDDLYRESERDSQPVKQLKRRLKMRLNQLATAWGKRRSRHGGSFDKEQKTAQATIEEEIKKFLDFDHNRDRDGQKSLGETDRNVSAFEKGLLARALIKRGRQVKQELTGFKQKLMDQVGQIRDSLMKELATQAIEKGVHVAAVQTGVPIGIIKQSVDIAQQLKQQEAAFNERVAKTPEQQAAAAQQVLNYVGEVAAGNIAPPGATPNGFADHVINGPSQGGVSR